MVAALTGADFFEIVPVEVYSSDDISYNDNDSRANKEQNDNSVRSEIADQVLNMDQYDVAILAHPIWWGEEPRIMDTFMESYDFSGKTLVNFCTSGGSGVATSTEHLKALAPDANWLVGHRFESGASKEVILSWIDSLGLIFAEKEEGGEMLYIEIGETILEAELYDNDSVAAWSRPVHLCRLLSL